MPLSPIDAWIVVVAHSIVLFLFASKGLERFLASHTVGPGLEFPGIDVLWVAFDKGVARVNDNPVWDTSPELERR